MSEHTLIAFFEDLEDAGHVSHEVAPPHEMVAKIGTMKDILSDPNFKKLHYTIGHWVVDVYVE